MSAPRPTNSVTATATLRVLPIPLPKLYHRHTIVRRWVPDPLRSRPRVRRKATIPENKVATLSQSRITNISRGLGTGVPPDEATVGLPYTARPGTRCLPRPGRPYTSFASGPGGRESVSGRGSDTFLKTVEPPSRHTRV